MSILNIKEKFSRRIVDAENELPVSNPQQTPANLNTPVCDDAPCEKDVGITEYVSDLPGFHAIIKQRFSDFNVHEINKNNIMAKLTSYALPDESLQLGDAEEPPLDEDTIKALQTLSEKTDLSDPFLIDVTTVEKSKRTEIHKYVKLKFGSSLVSNTVDNDDKKLISITRATNNSRDSRYPGHLPKYLHFVLSKSNMDTSEAIHILATKLRLKANLINIAGTKDKRANTSQWVSIKGTSAAKLLKLNKTLRRIWLGNFSYEDNNLSLGSLKGNHFEIALRNIIAPNEVIDESMEKLKNNGFLNYFGLQRFGNFAEAPTHEIGKLLINEEYGKAIELLLKPRKDPRNPDLARAREIYATSNDAEKAYSQIRSKDRTIEGKILLGLKTHGPQAYINALDTLPRNVRLLYLHSYQSYLWNKIVSRRIASNGLAVLKGDLVLIDVNAEDEPVEEIKEENVETNTTAVKHCPEKNVSNSSIEEESITDSKTSVEAAKKTCPVKHVRAEELDKYTIYDVLFPIPGTDIIYPDNEVKEWFEEALAEDGLTFESLSSHIRKYSLAGSYRKILLRPKNMTWRIVHYNFPEEDLILNDPDILEGKTLPERPKGDYRALVFSFELSRSAYATMALRELLRSDTSSTSQRALNGIKRNLDEPEPEECVKKLKTEEDLTNSELVDV